LTNDPSDDDEGRNDTDSNLNRGSDGYSNSDFHFAYSRVESQLLFRAFEEFGGGEEGIPFAAIHTEVTCSAALPTMGSKIRPMKAKNGKRVRSSKYTREDGEDEPLGML